MLITVWYVPASQFHFSGGGRQATRWVMMQISCWFPAKLGTSLQTTGSWLIAVANLFETMMLNCYKVILTCACVTTGSGGGADISLGGRQVHMRCLDDQGPLMGRQSLNAPPNSQPARHTRKVCPLNKNRQTNFSPSTKNCSGCAFFCIHIDSVNLGGWSLYWTAAFVAVFQCLWGTWGMMMKGNKPHLSPPIS